VYENSEPKPLNHYARQKYRSEQDIIESKHTYIIVRPVTAFGITERTRIDLLVNTLIYEALSTGKITVYEPNIMRPIIHVIDFASILRNAVNGILQDNQVYNIGDPFYTMTKAQLAKEISMLCRATLYHTDGTSLDPRNYDVSFDKLMNTGFRFGGNRLSLAVQQIKAAQNTITQNIQSFSTPYKVEQFLKESH
jgi:nucleoside-diphosphate-sugar epimerase